MRIDECTPCPRCGYSRVVQRSRAAYVCFQCRHSWTIDPTLVPAVYFSLEECARLVAYRGAIRAGLYTDW